MLGYNGCDQPNKINASVISLTLKSSTYREIYTIEH